MYIISRCARETSAGAADDLWIVPPPRLLTGFGWTAEIAGRGGATAVQGRQGLTEGGSTPFSSSQPSLPPLL